MAAKATVSDGAAVRVEYRKLDDAHIQILTFRPDRAEPIETIATIIPQPKPIQQSSTKPRI